MARHYKLAHHSAPSLNESYPAVRPDRNHYSSPATFFSNAMLRPRRNIAYPQLPLELRRPAK